MKSTKYAGESQRASKSARNETGSAHKYPSIKQGGAASGVGRLAKTKAYGKKA